MDYIRNCRREKSAPQRFQQSSRQSYKNMIVRPVVSVDTVFTGPVVDNTGIMPFDAQPAAAIARCTYL